MRIRRRDKDLAETGGSPEPAVAPYDYDQERAPEADPETNLIAQPAPADPANADSAADTATEGASSSPADQEDIEAPAAPEAGSVAPDGAQGTPEPQAAPSPVDPAASTADPAATAAEPVTAPAEAAPTDPAGPIPAAPAPQAVAVEPETAAAEVPEPVVARRAAPAPKHAMRAPSIGDDATELLNGSKPAPRELPRIIAIANQKGGVGKTTTTVNLGAALAELDYRVLVIDLDPQGNATTGLGVEARNFEHSMYDVIMRDLPLEDCIEPTSVKNLFVAPATIDLAGVEIELVPAFSRELKLKRAIDSVVDDFDFVIIDCPPSLGLITVNGLAAADEVLVPIQCEYYALEGLSQLLRNVNLVSTNLNQTLEVSTIVLTMFDARTRLSVDVANEVREHFSERVCRAVIPRTVRLSEAPSFGQPITVFDPTSRGAVAYRELAKEVSNGAPQRSR
jgi:chromosome partitioning protein